MHQVMNSVFGNAIFPNTFRGLACLAEGARRPQGFGCEGPVGLVMVNMNDALTGLTVRSTLALMYMEMAILCQNLCENTCDVADLFKLATVSILWMALVCFMKYTQEYPDF